MSTYTRVTVLGARRRVDLVAPGDEAVAALIPQLVDLLDEHTESAARPMTLIRASGDQLGAEESLDDQGVLAGDVLRLVRVDDAPAPPEVADVTDVVAATRDDQRGLWSDRHRITSGSIGVAALTAAAGSLLLANGVWPVLGAAAVGLLAGAVVFGLTGIPRVALTLTAAAVGLAAPASVRATETFLPVGASPAMTFFGVTAVVWIVVGIGIGVALRQHALLRGSIIGVAGGVVALGADATGISVTQDAAIVGTMAVVLIGLLPWFAMTASGLTGLDDLVIAGTLPDRDNLRGTVHDAYRSLSWTAVAVAVPACVAATTLVVSTDPWAFGLGVCVTLVLALRTRAFPLAWQALPLWTTVGITCVIAAVAHAQQYPELVIGGLIAAAVASAVIVIARPTRQMRARLRRLGNRVETVAVVALVPGVIGVFGVYPSLLATFR